MERFISFCGLFIMMGLAWLLSSHKSRVPFRIVIGGVLLQFGLGVLLLKTEPGRVVFHAVGGFFTNLLDFVDEGSRMVFGDNFGDFYF